MEKRGASKMKVIKVSTKAKILPTISEEVDTVNQSDSTINREYEFDGFIERNKKVDTQEKEKEPIQKNSQIEDKENEAESEKDEESWKCEFCREKVKKMLDCDKCHKWACKKCVGVTSIPKMTQIGNLTKEAEGLEWHCEECRKELQFQLKFNENSRDEIGYKERVIDQVTDENNQLKRDLQKYRNNLMQQRDVDGENLEISKLKEKIEKSN